MKKTRQRRFGSRHLPTILKIVAVLLMSEFLNLTDGRGNPPAQIRDTYVTIDATDASLREVLETIESQSDLKFTYPDEMKPLLTKVVTVREKNISAHKLLDRLLPGFGLQYSVSGTQVRIHKAASGSRGVAQTVSGTVISGTDNTPLAGERRRLVYLHHSCQIEICYLLLRRIRYEENPCRGFRTFQTRFAG